MKGRALSAIALGAAASVLAYACLRAGAHFVTDEPDPALVIWSEHASFYWRSTASAFAGIFAAIAAALLPDARVAKILPPAIIVAAVAIAVQALFIP